MHARSGRGWSRGTSYPNLIRWKSAAESMEKHGSTPIRNMIFDVPEIEEISRSMTLYPGDIISTGTCGGGGVGTGKWLKPGDIVECYVERIGTLSNPVTAVT